MKYQLHKTSRLGNRMVNEDRVGVAHGDDAVLLVLADGMGGYRGGQLASSALVERMQRQFRRAAHPIADPPEFLKGLVADAHLAVIRKGAEQFPPVQPRTTCVACLVQQGRAWWAHVGDSRIYLIRDGRVLTRTRDHSRIEELQRSGKITAKEAETHPERNLVTRCVGSQKLPPRPTFSDETTLQRGDILILCSDGLWGGIDEAMMIEALAKHTLADAVERMAYQAEFRSYPEADNISLVAFRWISDEAQPANENAPEEDELTETIKALDQALGKDE
jgi:serine/threonine protein phosphatase PrpC